MSKNTQAKANPFTLITGLVLVLAAIAFATPAKADTAAYPGTYTCRGDGSGNTVVKFDGVTPAMVRAWGDGCGNGRGIMPNARGEYVVPNACHWNFTFQIDNRGYWEYVPNVLTPTGSGGQGVVMNYKGSGCKVENTAPWGNAAEGAALRLGDASAPPYPTRR